MHRRSCVFQFLVYHFHAQMPLCDKSRCSRSSEIKRISALGALKHPQVLFDPYLLCAAFELPEKHKNVVVSIAGMLFGQPQQEAAARADVEGRTIVTRE